MQDFLTKAGGLLNRLTGGAQQLGLGGLMYGSSQIQEPLKRTFGLPTTGDYLRQWEAQRTNPMQRAKVGQPMILGGRLGYKAADGSWQPRGDMESANIPQYLPGSPQADKRGYVWDSPRGQAPGSQPPGTTPPAVVPRLSPEEQAYNAERSRIAQLTAQNPEFQNIGQLRNDLRDRGMEIWAKANPTLAAKVKPGQSGYDAIQRTIGIQELTPIEKRAEFTWNQATQGPAAAGLVVDPMLNPAGSNFIGGEGPTPMNFADPRFENMSPEEFQKLLNQVNKK